MRGRCGFDARSVQHSFDSAARSVLHSLCSAARSYAGCSEDRRLCAHIESGQRELTRIRCRVGAMLIAMGVLCGATYEAAPAETRRGAAGRSARPRCEG